MSGTGDLLSTGCVAEDSVKSIAAQRPVLVHTCSRIGRVANPPGFSFSAWFKAGRRR